MNHPHKSQAATMDRAGELLAGEQLRECINSGQVSAAQVVAHAEAGELPEPTAYRFNVLEGNDSEVSWFYKEGRAEKSPFTIQNLFTEEQMHAALAAERAEVARLRDVLHDIRQRASDMEIYYLADAALTAPGDKHE